MSSASEIASSVFDFFSSTIVGEILVIVMLAGSAKLYRWFNGSPALSKNKEVCFWVVNLFIAFLLVSAVQYIRSGSAGDVPRLQTQAGRLQVANSTTPPGVVLLFELEIFNAGSPTVLRDWALEVRIGKDAPVMGVLNIGNFYATSPAYTNDYKTSDLFPYIGLKEPIPRGGNRKGHVSFSLPNMNEKLLMAPGNLFRVMVKDVNNKVYFCDWTLGAAMKTIP